jgi:hypothetical protein
VSFKGGDAGVNGDVSIYDVPFPVGGLAMVENMDGSFVVTEEMVEVLLAGGVYCEVYTAEYPFGELRGQVVAAKVGVSFNLAPENEVPPATSSGYGQIDLYRFMDGDNIGAILYSLKVFSADSQVTAVHLHAGAAGTNGALFYDFGFTPFDTYPAQLTGIITDETVLSDFMMYMNMNSIYVNVHTASIPSGELRGQVDFTYSDSLKSDDDKKSDDDGKPKPIVPVVIELFEEAVEVNGWYDNSGMMDTFDSTPSRRLEVSNGYPVPRILTYPKYTIANAMNTKLIHTGSICKMEGKRASFERCEEKLPANGEFIFRATGWVPKNNDDTWKFCGVTGTIGQELQFEMKKGKCVPGQLIDAYDLCADGGSEVNFVGTVEFRGVTMSEMTRYEALMFENEIAEMMGSVLSVSMNSYEQTSTGLQITFGMTVAAERYNVDATIVDNISPFVSTIQNTLSRKLENDLFKKSAAKVAAAGYPRSSLLDSQHASLLSFNYIGVKYLSPLPEDMVVSYPDYATFEESSTSSSSTESSFPLASVAAVFGVTVLVAFVAMKVRGNGAAKFEPLPTASEHPTELAEDSRLSAFDLGMETSQEAL